MNHLKELNDGEDFFSPHECDIHEDDAFDLIDKNSKYAKSMAKCLSLRRSSEGFNEENEFDIGKLKKRRSAAAILQPYSGLKGLAESVRRVPDRAPMRNPSLCSLARVYDEVEKSNPDAEPFYVKDLVMVDAKLRDWKRIMPTIKPSYDVKCSHDSQILKRLVQGGAVFSCDDEEDLELLDCLGEDLIAMLHKAPTKLSGNVMVFAESEEDLKSIYEQNPTSQVLIRLPRDLPNKGSPRDELVKLLKVASDYKIKVVGLSLHLWNTFEESELRQSLIELKELSSCAKNLGHIFSTINVENELPDINFEKCAKQFKKITEFYFPKGGDIQFHLSANVHFSECSHFLFTRVVSKLPRNDSEGRYYELHLDWPESSLLRLNSKPETCLPAKNEALSRHIIFSNSCKTTITEVLLPSTIMVGEWLYWNNIPSPHPKNAKSQTKNYHSFRFEGPEKKFELNYKPIEGDAKGLRSLGSEEWQEILNHGHLLILSEKKNEHFDSYLLSESSLFVYPYKVIIKTCGISSPLLCTKALRESATKLGTEIESIVFSRRSFICPLGQCFPHRTIEEELGFLNKHFPGGESLKLGDPTTDHWFLYSAKLTPNAKFDSNPSLEVTMTGRMKPEALKLFWRDENASAGSVADKSGFAELTKGADIDEYSFTPCGFSYNGLLDEGFVTVHITPELPLCYISFETTISNLPYENIIQKLISTFEPAHFTSLILNHGENTRNINGYKRTHQNNTKMGGIPVAFERRKKVK